MGAGAMTEIQRPHRRRMMKLRRIWVSGLPPEWATPFAEFMIFHGVDRVKVTDRPEMQKLEIEFSYVGDVR